MSWIDDFGGFDVALLIDQDRNRVIQLNRVVDVAGTGCQAVIDLSIRANV
jgi:hypothetical protein